MQLRADLNQGGIVADPSIAPHDDSANVYQHGIATVERQR
jgi:hypothetical protein